MRGYLNFPSFFQSISDYVKLDLLSVSRTIVTTVLFCISSSELYAMDTPFT